MKKLFAHRHSGILLYCLSYAAICAFVRLLLIGFQTWRAAHNPDAGSFAWDGTMLLAFPIGFGFDVLMALFFCIPLALLLAVMPQSLFISRIGKLTVHGFLVFSLVCILFGEAAEVLFWEEFDCRFNFISVDYLVYGREVIDNIVQSYPVAWIFAGIVLVAVVLYALWLRLAAVKVWFEESKGGLLERAAGLGACLLVPAVALGLAYKIGSKDMARTDPHAHFSEKIPAGLRHMEAAAPAFKNSYNRELAQNGAYAFVAAYFANELDWNQFYPTVNPRQAADKPPTDALLRLRSLLAQDNASFVSADPADITRLIKADGAEKKLNVIQITVESLSYEFLGCYPGGGQFAERKLTPHLDRLANEGLFFDHLYAGGTRTVRGMEALALSIPPTPGQSVLRRLHNEGLFSLPGLFASKGYDSVFIYGGYGYFDNMNYFFQNNGARVVDQKVKNDNGFKASSKDDASFANAWGVCDEGLFDWVIEEADAAYAKRQPFYHFVMTTSNHRPFTWPKGRIDIPPGADSDADRISGGVKYTDYAINRLIEQARTKPWFKDTVFVIVADHDMKVAGKQELVVKKYEIPMIIYCPAHIKPRRVETLCSQIDYAPTLLGLLNFTYESKFMGRDVLRDQTGWTPRAFISNYQKVGYLHDKHLSVMMPVKTDKYFDCDRATGDLKLESTVVNDKATNDLSADARAYYECAAYLYTHDRLKMPEEPGVQAAPKAPAVEKAQAVQPVMEPTAPALEKPEDIPEKPAPKPAPYKGIFRVR